jgi:restriction system protein
MSLKRSETRVSYGSRGTPTYLIEMSHTDLHKHRIIRGTDRHVVETKADLQAREWQEQWTTRSNKWSLQQSREQKKQTAAERTEEAQRTQEDLASILKHTLDVDDGIEWDLLKDRSEFSLKAPVESRPSLSALPPEPALKVPEITFMDRVLPGRVNAKHAAVDEENDRARAAWQEDCDRIKKENASRIALAGDTYAREKAEWDRQQHEFNSAQVAKNAAIDEAAAQYQVGAPEAITGYCDLVLSRSEYPDCVPKEWELDYNADTRTLVVDYSLLAPDAIPRTIEVKYLQSRDEIVEKSLTDSQAARLYDDVLYQIALRTIHELFEADAIDALVAFAFNGYVRSIDRATGNETNACVMSLHVAKDAFSKINLAQVEPKVCFKQLRGVGSSKLHSATPVPPVMTVRREDGRFVSARDVANQLDEGYNLAAMDWEEFEHLIREVFAKEFSASGGEVKVTRASRDGGVDAVAFDPDPIRGGKIVIQAKRYTATVSVAAVRDLYGTVMNEGATKGILVTTSDYGPDAYDFAQGKPLTLLNGANLLHLLEKHGHRARIDLAEARSKALSGGIESAGV